MRVAIPTIIIFVAVAVAMPSPAAAQEPVKSFHQLNTRVSVGDTVRVTDAQGREIKGTITELHDASITLDGDSQTTLQADNVRLVQQRKGSKLLGCLIGLGAGIAAGIAFSADAGTAEEAMGGYLLPPIGAGVGTLVGAFMPRTRDIYRAPGASSSARLSLAPVITPRTKGVAVALSF